LPSSHHARRRRLPLALAVIATAVAVAVLGPTLVSAGGAVAAASGSTGASAGSGLTSGTGATNVVEDPNRDTCYGHVEPGAPESGVSGPQVRYQFSCDGPITGYSIQTEPHRIQFIDESPVVALAGVPSTTDSFACNAFLPGIQINCVGAASAPFEVITGQFVIAGRSVCAEPRVDPLLTVTEADATVAVGGTPDAPTATTSLFQYIVGPFDLGRPHRCPGDGFGSDSRLGPHPPRIVLPGRA